MCMTVVLASTSSAQVTLLVSVDSSGAQGNSACGDPSISADGRYVAFDSVASNLVPGDTNGLTDVFVRDRLTGTTERVSISTGGIEGDGFSVGPSISADGRYVAFESVATNLVPGDTNGERDVFVRDRQAGTTQRVSVDSSGMQMLGLSSFSSISADGRCVAFSNFHIFVRDLTLATTEMVSVATGGTPGNNNSFWPSISTDGRYVAFSSLATNLVPVDTNGFLDIFVHDRQLNTTERVSVGSFGAQANGDSYTQSPAISADGRYVAFKSAASNLVPGDTNAKFDAFVRDRQLGTTERVSVDSSGVQGNDDTGYCSISADGRYVSYFSAATNLVAGDTNGSIDVFLRDRQLGTTERVSVSSNGAQGNSSSYFSTLSGDDRFVAFASYASTLVGSDINNQADIFVRDRFASAFTSLCDPGLGGVIACPCANPPSAPGRGCNNSSATGGAILSASGAAYVSMDSLVFTATAEKPTALSIFSQGSAFSTTGVVFGQGVRCANLNLKRLYTKSAVGGTTSAPTGGDPAIHVRSAALGDTIAPGTSRYYYVYYRDPNVLGGCPSASAFNSTQTARIDWSL
jgi:Tol biopolymer transport system component